MYEELVEKVAERILFCGFGRRAADAISCYQKNTVKAYCWDKIHSENFAQT